MTTVSVNPSRGATKASGPWLLSIRSVEPGGGSTRLALATKTSDRSRMYCISGWEMSQSRITGCSTALGFA